MNTTLLDIYKLFYNSDSEQQYYLPRIKKFIDTTGKSAEQTIVSIDILLKNMGYMDTIRLVQAFKGYDNLVRGFSIDTVRTVQHLINHPTLNNCIEVADRYIKGQATIDDLKEAESKGWNCLSDGWNGAEACHSARKAALGLVMENGLKTLDFCAKEVGYAIAKSDYDDVLLDKEILARAIERHKCADLARAAENNGVEDPILTKKWVEASELCDIDKLNSEKRMAEHIKWRDNNPLLYKEWKSKYEQRLQDEMTRQAIEFTKITQKTTN